MSAFASDNLRAPTAEMEREAQQPGAAAATHAPGSAQRDGVISQADRGPAALLESQAVAHTPAKARKLGDVPLRCLASGRDPERLVVGAVAHQLVSQVE